MPTVRDIVRSAVTQFLPGWALTLVALTLITSPASFGEITWHQWLWMSGLSLTLMAGHVATLLGLRRRLREDANVTGRKSAVAGACSVGAILITSFSAHGGRGVGIVIATYFLVGALVTGALYFPWIRVGAGSPEARDRAPT